MGRNLRKRTKHELFWLTAISDAGSTPAASTINKSFTMNGLSDQAKILGQNYTVASEILLDFSK
jgi:hypothetical protein